jgi:hypothetical protein
LAAAQNFLTPAEKRVNIIDNERMHDSTTPVDPEPVPLPDHLSVDPRSPHYVAAALAHEIGIRLNGQERFDVQEYCISQSWVKVPAGKTLDRRGQPLLIKLKGKVEAFYK